MIKKLGKILLTFLLVFSLAFVWNPVMQATDAHAATTFAGGDGSLSNPYQITTKAQLNSVRNYPSKNYKLMNNLSFSDADFRSGGAYYNSGAEWSPIGSFSAPFTGTFNGNGKRISGLKVNMTAGGNGGLFGFNNGTISNLGISGGTISVTGSVFASAGGIAGEGSGTIQNCYNSATIISAGTAGGIVGKITNGTITKCFNAGSITGIAEVGGVCGYFAEGTLSYCYNTGKVIGNATSSGNHIGGIAGASDSCTLKQCYNTGLVEAEFSVTGGITAYRSSATLTSCYYLAGSGENGEGISLSLSQMGQTTSFAGFDFTNIWAMNTYNHLPALRTCPVRPAALTSISLNLDVANSDASVRYRTIKASWSTASNASGYKIAYKKSTDANYSTNYITGTSWTFLADPGSKYYVKVIPYISVAGVKYYSNAYSPEKYVYTLKATTLSLTKSGTQDVKVQWTNISGESGYCIYRKTGSTGTWARIKVVSSSTATSWTDYSTVDGKTYYYKVRAYKAVGSSYVYGPLSTEKYLHL